MSTIVCSICQENLTEIPEILPEGNDLTIVALHCGHLFHMVCVRQWFTGRTVHIPDLDRTLKDCPCCKTRTSLSNAIKIYPTCDEDIQLTRNLDRVQKQNEELTKALEKRNQDLIAEMEAHDTLKIQHAEILSKNDDLQTRLNAAIEEKEFEEAVVNSVSTQLVENTNRENRALLRRIRDLEAEVARHRNFNIDESAIEVDRAGQLLAQNLSIVEVSSDDEEENAWPPVLTSTMIAFQ